MSELVSSRNFTASLELVSDRAGYEVFDGIELLFSQPGQADASDTTFSKLVWEDIDHNPYSRLKQLRLPGNKVDRILKNDRVDVAAEHIRLFGKVALPGQLKLKSGDLAPRQLLGLCAYLAKSLPHEPSPDLSFDYRGGLPTTGWQFTTTEPASTVVERIEDPCYSINTVLSLNHDSTEDDYLASDKSCVRFAGSVCISRTRPASSFIATVYNQAKIVNHLSGESQKNQVFRLYGAQDFDELTQLWGQAMAHPNGIAAARSIL